jgi:predicted RND superfamily exporter protein
VGLTAFIRSIVLTAYRRRTIVGVGFLSLGLIASAGVTRLSFDTDVLSLLPQKGRAIPGFKEFLAKFGNLDQLYLVFTAPEGQSIDDYADDVDAWVEQLRQAPEIRGVEVAAVDTSRDFSWLADHQLLLLNDRALDEALARLTPDGLAKAVVSRRELLALPSNEIAQLVRQDPAGISELSLDAVGVRPNEAAADRITAEYVSADGRRRLVIAHPARPPFDTEFSRALDVRLRDIQSALARGPNEQLENADGARPPLTVSFAGGHQIAVETEGLVRREAIVNTVASLLTIMPLLFVVFRSLWLVVVGAVPSALALLVVLGMMGFGRVTLSAAAAGSAAMLFGLGIDGVVLMYVAHRLAVAEGRTPEAAVAATAGPSTSMLLGMWTTAATFYGLAVVDFPSLQQLGQLIGHSMLLCGVFTLLLVPALLSHRPPRSAVKALTMPGLARWIGRHQRGILAVSVAATLILGLAALRLRINPTLDRLRSVTNAARLEETVAVDFNLPRDVYVALAKGPDLERLLEENERLVERLSALRDLRTESAARLLPSETVQRQRAERIRQSGLTPAAVTASLERAGALAGFKKDAFEPFVARLPRLLDANSRIGYQAYEQQGLDDLVGRFIRRDGAGWISATYIFPANTDQTPAIQAIVDSGNAGAILTGLPLVNREMAATFLPQFVKGLAIGSLAVVLLIAATFRSVRLSILALLPTAVGLLWTAGVLAAASVELDLFAMFAVVTFVGIGVDYGVHVVHRSQESQSPHTAIAELAPVILVAGAITLFGYGTLIYSSYPPLRSIGLIAAVSVPALVVASVLVLPALLVRYWR